MEKKGRKLIEESKGSLFSNLNHQKTKVSQILKRKLVWGEVVVYVYL